MLTRMQYLSGKVRRWHTHHDLNQTNADHSWGVAMILLKIHPDPSSALIKAALLHDCGEILVGDIPTYSKRNIPGLKDLLDVAEVGAMHSMQLQFPSLTNEERQWLSLADALEAAMFVCHCGRFSEAEAVEYFPAMFQKVNEYATALGVDVTGLTGGITR